MNFKVIKALWKIAKDGNYTPGPLGAIVPTPTTPAAEATQQPPTAEEQAKNKEGKPSPLLKDLALGNAIVSSVAGPTAPFIEAYLRTKTDVADTQGTTPTKKTEKLEALQKQLNNSVGRQEALEGPLKMSRTDAAKLNAQIEQQKRIVEANKEVEKLQIERDKLAAQQRNQRQQNKNSKNQQQPSGNNQRPRKNHAASFINMQLRQKLNAALKTANELAGISVPAGAKIKHPPRIPEVNSPILTRNGYTVEKGKVVPLNTEAGIIARQNLGDRIAPLAAARTYGKNLIKILFKSGWGSVGRAAGVVGYPILSWIGYGAAKNQYDNDNAEYQKHLLESAYERDFRDAKGNAR